VMPDLSAEEIARTDFGAYTADQFLDDMARVTEYRCDPDLTELLVKNSLATAIWMRGKGVRFTAAWGRQAFNINGRFKFWGGLTVEAVGGGPGLVDSLTQIAKKNGVEIWYGAKAVSLVADDAGVRGVVLKHQGKTRTLSSKSVVLAAGGFQANPEMRARYLGPGWELAKVRGTRYNVGDGLKMALDIGAMPWGHWSGCHATPINAEAADYGVQNLTDKTNRLSYFLGVMLNTEGKRWVDEGADINSFTYAKYGGMILKQPRSLVYQIFDSKVLSLLEPRYSTSEPFKSDTLEGLVKQLQLDHEQALKTLKEYNDAAGHGGPFNPAVLDGMHTVGVEPKKSNWAVKLDQPPFVSYPTTGGITFTFGGLKINKDTQVIATDWKPIPGLYTCGEMVGGLFHYNYPLGTGLMSGAVFGRIAGRSAARS